MEYASKNKGVMHACGHDCHVAIMLTAAAVLNDNKEDLCGTVKLAFQPAEEIAEGAKSMVEQGAMDGVDGCFAIHVWSDVETGHVTCDAGPRMAAAYQFIIDVQGKGGHGAAPHQCIDAAVASAAIVNNLQTVVSRETSPVDPAVVTVGVIDVGERWNVVPDKGHIEGTVRCFSDYLWKEIPAMMERIVKDTAKAPGAVALLGVRNETCGATWAQHSAKYRVDEDALMKGALLYSQVAMDFNSQK